MGKKGHRSNFFPDFQDIFSIFNDFSRFFLTFFLKKTLFPVFPDRCEPCLNFRVDVDQAQNKKRCTLGWR